MNASQVNAHRLDATIINPENRARAVAHLRAHGVRLPCFSDLADPARMAEGVRGALDGVEADAADARNLFRVTWHNDAARTGMVPVPMYLDLPEALTGVPAPILLALGDRFPMIGAHKVLAAYGCLAPRIVTGGFDPTGHRAIWPSTGNYCRGGDPESPTRNELSDFSQL